MKYQSKFPFSNSDIIEFLYSHYKTSPKSNTFQTSINVLLKIKGRASINLPVKITITELNNQSRICLKVNILNTYLLFTLFSVLLITLTFFMTNFESVFYIGASIHILILLYLSSKVNSQLIRLDNNIHNKYKNFVSNK
jgi:hypothetical protein